jgi:hypothetical protein
MADGLGARPGCEPMSCGAWGLATAARFLRRPRITEPQRHADERRLFPCSAAGPSDRSLPRELFRNPIRHRSSPHTTIVLVPVSSAARRAPYRRQVSAPPNCLQGGSRWPKTATFVLPPSSSGLADGSAIAYGFDRCQNW